MEEKYLLILFIALMALTAFGVLWYSLRLQRLKLRRSQEMLAKARLDPVPRNRPYRETLNVKSAYIPPTDTHWRRANRCERCSASIADDEQFCSYCRSLRAAGSRISESTAQATHHNGVEIASALPTFQSGGGGDFVGGGATGEWREDPKPFMAAEITPAPTPTSCSAADYSSPSPSPSPSPSSDYSSPSPSPSSDSPSSSPSSD